jgi:hypothetical protein
MACPLGSGPQTFLRRTAESDLVALGVVSAASATGTFSTKAVFRIKYWKRSTSTTKNYIGFESTVGVFFLYFNLNCPSRFALEQLFNCT